MKTDQNRLFEDFPEISSKQWEEKIIADLKGADYQKKLIWQSDEDIQVRPYYRQEDAEKIAFSGIAGSLKKPAEEPNSWSICQDVFTASEPGECNERIHASLKGGAQAIRIHLEAGPDAEQLSTMLKGVNLTETELHFVGCDDAPGLYKMLSTLATARGCSVKDLKGCLGADPLGKMSSTGRSVGTSDLAKLVRKVAKASPELRVIEVNGALIQNAGATLIEEMAFSLAMASEYLDLLTEQGLDAAMAAASLQFSLATGPNYFMEIAKLRAMRILWQGLTSGFGCKDLIPVHLHTSSSEWNMTLYDPHVNMLRGTTEAMSAILGGADSLSVLPYDYPYGRTTEFSDRIARNVQIILREEAYFDRVSDPASGSYYIETLTDAMASNAWERFKLCEESGGYTAAFKAGKLQAQIAESREKKRRRSQSGRDHILGTNAFPNFNELILEQLQQTRQEVISDTEFEALPAFRRSADFEELRLETERSGKRPKVLLLKYGPPAWMTARAMFAGNFFACAGYEILDRPPVKDLANGLETARTEKADIVVLCSADDQYAETAPKAQAELGSSAIIVVAGYPKEALEQLQEAGIEHFIHMRCNLLETLKSFNKQLL